MLLIGDLEGEMPLVVFSLPYVRDIKIVLYLKDCHVRKRQNFSEMSQKMGQERAGSNYKEEGKKMISRTISQPQKDVGAKKDPEKLMQAMEDVNMKTILGVFE